MGKKSTKEEWPVDSAAQAKEATQSWSRRHKQGLQLAGSLAGVAMVAGVFGAANYFPREHDGAIYDSLSAQLGHGAKGFNAERLTVDGGGAMANLELPDCTIAGVTVDYKTLPNGQYSVTGFEYPEGNGYTLKFTDERNLAETLTNDPNGNPCGKLAIAAAANVQPGL